MKELEENSNKKIKENKAEIEIEKNERCEMDQDILQEV